jgi:hypothetical protein
MGKRSKRKQARRTQQKDVFEPLVKKLKGSDILGERQIVIRQSEEKMSDKLLNLIEPYKQYADSREAMEKLVVLGLMAWNTAVMQAKGGHVPAMGDLFKLFGPDEKLGREMVNALIERKKKLYPDNHRMIMEYHLTDRGADYHLSVASTLD